MKKFAGFLVLVIVFGVTGCASKSSESVVSQDSAVSPGSGYGQDSGRIYSESEAALRDEARRVLKDVFFAFESAEIDDQAALQLKNNAIWMRANQVFRLLSKVIVTRGEPPSTIWPLVSDVLIWQKVFL
jgi:peptidoglycan-associated lipoprotein